MHEIDGSRRPAVALAAMVLVAVVLVVAVVVVVSQPSPAPVRAELRSLAVDAPTALLVAQVERAAGLSTDDPMVASRLARQRSAAMADPDPLAAAVWVASVVRTGGTPDTAAVDRGRSAVRSALGAPVERSTADRWLVAVEVAPELEVDVGRSPVRWWALRSEGDARLAARMVDALVRHGRWQETRAVVTRLEEAVGSDRPVSIRTALAVALALARVDRPVPHPPASAAELVGCGARVHLVLATVGSDDCDLEATRDALELGRLAPGWRAVRARIRAAR